MHQMIRKRARATTPPPTDLDGEEPLVLAVHVPSAKRQRTTGPDAWNASARTPIHDEEDEEEDGEAGETREGEEDESQWPRIRIRQPPMRARAPSPPAIEPKLEDAYASINHILHTTRHQRTHIPAPTSSPISNPMLFHRHQYSPARRSPLGLHSTQKEIPQTLSSSPLSSSPQAKPRSNERLAQPTRTPAKPIELEKECVIARYEDINKSVPAQSYPTFALAH